PSQTSHQISRFYGLCKYLTCPRNLFKLKEEVQETDQMADESRANTGRSKSPPFRHLFVAILLIGLALGASYAGYLGASSAYSQLRLLVLRLKGTNNQINRSAARAI